MVKQESLIDRYQDHLVGQGKSPNTIKAYGRDVGAFALWWEQTYGQTFNPQAVTSPDIQEYRGYLVRGGSKPATVNRRLIALRRFFAWLKRERQITDSPFEVLEQVLVNEVRWLVEVPGQYGYLPKISRLGRPRKHPKLHVPNHTVT